MSTTQTNETATDERWWFTFGTNHRHPTTGVNLGNSYVVVPGTYEESRRLMLAAFGQKWSHQYESAERAGVARWGLTQVEVPAVADVLDTATCGCPVRRAPEIRGDAADTLVEHVDSCTTEDDEAAELETEAAPEPETQRAAFTRGLREIADWLDAHPEVPLPYMDKVMTGKFRPTFTVYIGSWSGDQREQLAAVGRAMGRFDKHAQPDDDHFVVYRQFGGITFAAQADREEVCTKVVTGTREVTEEVPDPEALKAVPKVTVTKVVEDVEWVCHPLLAEPAQLAAAVLTPDAPELPA